jgi:hypothetical protein
MTFGQLSEAVEFLAARLDVGDLDGIADECSAAAIDSADGVPSRRPSRLGAIDELGRQHRSRDIRRLYEGRQFPDDLLQFKLGGHGAELGHVHVDFARAGESWVLKEIWICR